MRASAACSPSQWCCTGPLEWLRPSAACSRLRPLQESVLSATAKQERGCFFATDNAFFRPGSSQARDLEVLTAARYHHEHACLHVIELLSGSAVRGKRLLEQAKADFVLCNEGNWRGNRAAMLANLLAACPAADFTDLQEADQLLAEHPELATQWQGEVQATGRKASCCVMHWHASKLLLKVALEGQRFDLVDLDCFGSVSSAALIGPALDVVKPGGLLYLTGTDGLAAAGRAPFNALAAYGAATQPVPFANEVGVRLLIGGACQAAARRGLAVEPLFSLYAPHGPVFRAMLRVCAGAAPGESLRHLQFVAHNPASGHSQALGWDALSSMQPGSRVCGPLWAGPLHSSLHVKAMIAEARQRGWQEPDPSAPAVQGLRQGLPLGQLLQVMLGESDLRLPPWHLDTDRVASSARLSRPPGRDKLIAALCAQGFAACATQFGPKTLKTDADEAGLAAAAHAVTG